MDVVAEGMAAEESVASWEIGDAKTVTVEEMRRAKMVNCIIARNNKRTIGCLGFKGIAIR